MKTKNLLMAAFALLGASCSQNEIMESRQDADASIGFDVYTGVATTKGTDVSTTTMQKTVDELGGFGVMGYYTGSKTWENADKSKIAPTFMFNQLVTYSVDKWTYTPIKYWPNNTSDKVSFFAYAPYEYNGADKKRVGITTSQISDAGVPFIEFTLKENNDLDKMVDLVVAKELDKSAESSTINFKFEHILSKIGFQVKLGAEYAGLDGTESFVYITHMWIVGKTDQSSVSVSDNKLINDKSKFYKKATWKDLHWNYNDADIAQVDYDLTNLLNREQKGITEIWENGDTKVVRGIKLTKENKTNSVNLFPDGQFLYLIPVNETVAEVSTNDTEGGCGNGEIQIGFHYDIVTKTASSSLDNPQYLVSHFESAVPLPEHHMKRGKFYNYTFVINLKEITISEATVKDWDDTPGNSQIN